MTVLQAILISGIYWFSAVETPYCLYYLMTTPMCAGALTGLILGDITTGLIVGAAVQMIFLAPSGFGGVVPTDKPAAGIITTAAVITTGISVETGVVLAVPAALLFAQLHTVRRLAASIWVHMADKYAEEGNTRGIVLAGTLYPTLLKIPLFWLPMMLMVYFGTGAVGDIVNSLPQFLMNGLNAAGMLLPALGFAMTIRMIGRRELMPFFVGGFFFLRYSNLGTIPVVLVALFLAYLYIMFTKDNSEISAKDVLSNIRSDAAAHSAEGRLLTMKDVNKTWGCWYLAAEMSNSFERLQSLAFCISFIPAINKLYKDNPEEKKAALKRHLTFFNTEGNLGAVIHGIALSMEEQRAMGQPITGDMIVNLKTGLMGPMAGVGDSIIWSTIAVIALAAALPGAAAGSVLSPILYVVGMGGFVALLGLLTTRLGYKLGTKAASTLLSGGIINRLLSFFAVLGLFMLGAMSASFVNVTTPLVIAAGETTVAVQSVIFDGILPGILTLATVWGVYEYLRKGKGNVMLKATLALLIVGLVLGGLGILG